MHKGGWSISHPPKICSIFMRQVVFMLMGGRAKRPRLEMVGDFFTNQRKNENLRTCHELIEAEVNL